MDFKELYSLNRRQIPNIYGIRNFLANSIIWDIPKSFKRSTMVLRKGMEIRKKPTKQTPCKWQDLGYETKDEDSPVVWTLARNISTGQWMVGCLPSTSDAWGSIRKFDVRHQQTAWFNWREFRPFFDGKICCCGCMYCIWLEGMDFLLYIHTFHLQGSLYHHIASLKLVLLLKGSWLALWPLCTLVVRVQNELTSYPDPWGMIQFDEHIFQLGWNHHGSTTNKKWINQTMINPGPISNFHKWSGFTTRFKGFWLKRVPFLWLSNGLGCFALMDCQVGCPKFGLERAPDECDGNSDRDLVSHVFIKEHQSVFIAFVLSLSHLYVIFDISFFRKVMEVAKFGGEQKNTSELIGILFHYCTCADGDCRNSPID